MNVEFEMGYANELVAAVREKAGLKLDTVAAKTHFSRSAINRYELGDVPVPAEYLSRLFWLTRDLRIIQFIDPSADLMRVDACRPVRVPPPGDPRQLLPELLAEIKTYGMICETAQRIVADGIVDAEDDNLITRLLEASNNLTATLCKAHRSIAHWRDQAGDRKGAAS